MQKETSLWLPLWYLQTLLILKQSHYKLNGNKTRTVTITKNQENMKQPQFGMPDKKKIKALLWCD
jgi:hypothetical protein